MQLPEITITLAKSKREYRLDDTLKGCVSIKINSDDEYSDVQVVKLWRTSGNGSEDSEYDQHGAVTIYKGRLKRGEYSFDFELPLDQAPLSYRGEKLNIDWYLAAFVTGDDGINYSREIDYFLKANPNNPDRHSLAKNNKEKVELDSSDKENYYNAEGVFFIGFCAGGGGLMFLSLNTLFGTITGLLLFLMTYHIIKRALKRKLSTKKLGDIKLSLPKAVYSIGERVNLRVNIEPDNKIIINQVTVALERVELSSVPGINSLTSAPTKLAERFVEQVEKHVAYNSETLTSDERDYFNYNFYFTIPSDAMCSFEANYNEIYWRISVDIDIKNSPSWEGGLIFQIVQ